MIKSTNSRKYQALVDWLKEQRQTKGLSMRDLAKKIGEQHSFIGKVGPCERRLDVYEYYQYCAALEVDPVNGLLILERV